LNTKLSAGGESKIFECRIRTHLRVLSKSLVDDLAEAFSKCNDVVDIFTSQSKGLI
jgi:hypothetical protein